MSTFGWIAFAAVLVVSSARITRLLTFDHFPPVEWLRDKFAEKTDGSKWQLLAYCPYCMSFWVTVILVVWAVLAGVVNDSPVLGAPGGRAEPIWWLVNGAFAASYLAAILMVRDGDDD